MSTRRPTVTVSVGGVRVGGAHPIVVQSMTNTDTADAAATAAQVRALHAAGEVEQAREVLSRAPAPLLPEIHQELVLLALARGDGTEAERHARAALEAAPGDVERMIEYALALVLAGQTKRALGVITNACKAAPDHPRTQPLLVYVRRLLDGTEAAPTRFAPGD